MRQTTHSIQHAATDMRCPRGRGFTLVEILIALAITALLLTAVAVAFNASVINYTVNESIFKAVNSSRQALFRITSQLRTATAVDPNAPVNECTLITADGENLTYRYDGSAKILYLITNDDATDPDYKLCENVASMTFTKSIVVDEDGVTKVRSVQIAIAVTSGGVERKMAAAAVIRRNLD